MAGLQSYLIFSGNCEEAVKFYCEALGGEVLFTMRYKDSPQDVPANWKEKIIHTTFKIRGTDVMASDGFPGHMPTVGNNMYLSLNFKKEDDMESPFKKLAQGGKITQDIQKTFWGANFGMLEDKFGNGWMFSQHLEDKK